MRVKNFILAIYCLLLQSLIQADDARPGLEFHSSEQIVLLGGTLIEREQKFGFLETELTLAAGESQFSVRNLGWSGDTVFGDARSYFGPRAEGFERLGKHLQTLKPSLVIACYGADMAFEDAAKIPGFIAGYSALLDLARAKSPGVRFIIIAPPPLENLGPPLPDYTQANGRLSSVRDALKDFAAKQSAFFVDGFAFMGGGKNERPAHPLTDNGIHYGEEGYRLWGAKVVESMGMKRAELSASAHDDMRRTIIRKDFLFFNRWRPANETYLFGFRKREQGKNGAEMEQFDPLVAEQEKKITELKTSARAVKTLP